MWDFLGFYKRRNHFRETIETLKRFLWDSSFLQVVVIYVYVLLFLCVFFLCAHSRTSLLSHNVHVCLFALKYNVAECSCGVLSLVPALFTLSDVCLFFKWLCEVLYFNSGMSDCSLAQSLVSVSDNKNKRQKRSSASWRSVYSSYPWL